MNSLSNQQKCGLFAPLRQDLVRTIREQIIKHPNTYFLLSNSGGEGKTSLINDLVQVADSKLINLHFPALELRDDFSRGLDRLLGYLSEPLPHSSEKEPQKSYFEQLYVRLFASALIALIEEGKIPSNGDQNHAVFLLKKDPEQLLNFTTAPTAMSAWLMRYFKQVEPLIVEKISKQTGVKVRELNQIFDLWSQYVFSSQEDLNREGDFYHGLISLTHVKELHLPAEKMFFLFLNLWSSQFALSLVFDHCEMELFKVPAIQSFFLQLMEMRRKAPQTSLIVALNKDYLTSFGEGFCFDTLSSRMNAEVVWLKPIDQKDRLLLLSYVTSPREYAYLQARVPQTIQSPRQVIQWVKSELEDYQEEVVEVKERPLTIDQQQLKPVTVDSSLRQVLSTQSIQPRVELPQKASFHKTESLPVSPFEAMESGEKKPEKPEAKKGVFSVFDEE